MNVNTDENVQLRDDLTCVTVADLMATTNWQQQYRTIIQWGKLIQPKLEMRVAGNLVQGCELPVWITHLARGKKHYFEFDSDSSVMNGLAVLLLVQINGKTTGDIQAVDVASGLRALGLERHLSPSRNNGFTRIMERILSLSDCN
jgi:cysteine desulfuration protein SufE